jgi:serine/threonine-protein kinase
MTTSTIDPFIGQVLEDRYRVDELIARGGMANVYRSTDLRLGRVVAVKILAGTLANDPNFVERFVQEARATASLMHPNVVAVHDQGLALGFPFLVLEFVPGRTIREVLNQYGPFTSAHALEIMRSVLAGLSAAHDAGFVHRDIKPENVLITNEGHIKVTDFGLARVISDQPASTSTGAVLLGTMAYLSPEQVQQQTIDARSDVYSSGILLYEMVTGQVPFTGSTPLDVAYRHVNEDVPAPSILQPDVPPAVDHLVLAATHRNINDRLHSARAFQDGVIRALSAVPQAEALTTALPISATQVLPPINVSPKLNKPIDNSIQSNNRKTKSGYFAQKKKSIMRLLVGLLTLITGAVLWFMFSGTYQVVPNITGQTIDQAAPQLANLQLTYEIVEEFSEEVPAGIILRTEPESGERARVGNPIKIFSSIGPERYVIPAEIIGRSISEVERILNDLNLVVSGTEEIFDDTIEAGKVASSNPAPGATLKRDTPVIIQISKGPQPVEIPAIVGVLLIEANPLLTSLGLTAEVVEEVFDPVAPIGMIISSDPVPGTLVAKGTTIKVKVSLGPPLVSVPNVVGMKTEKAIQVLEDAGFVVIKQNKLALAPLNTVYSQTPSGNSKVAPGSTILIEIV